MDVSPGSRLQEVLADFAEQYRALSKDSEQIKALSVTARSRDGVVEATVGADGRASAIRFTSMRFREMQGPALAGSVLEALTTARTEADARATAIVTSMEYRLSARLAPLLWSEPVTGGASRPGPVMCWRRVVREARSVAEGGALRGSGGVMDQGGHAECEALLGPGEAETSPPQGPLWGWDRSGPPSPFRHGPLPAELCEAIITLGAAVCGAAGGGGSCTFRGCEPDTPGRPGDGRQQ